MLVRFSDIVWDTDGESVDLPTTVELEGDSDIDLEDEGADVLSDEFGWCVASFAYEVL